MMKKRMLVIVINKKSLHMVKGQYDQAAGSLGLVFRIGMPVVFNRIGSGF